MKFKKLLPLVVSTALVASIAMSAGASSAATTIAPEKNAKLLVWDDKDAKATWDKLIPKFVAKYKAYNVTVKYQTVGGPDQDEKFATDGPAGIAADVGVIPHDNLAKLVEAGLWMQNIYFAKETKANNIKAGITASTYEGKLYGYPKAIETYALYYNKELVKKAIGKTTISSWADVTNIAKNSTVHNPAKKKYAFMMEVNNFYFNYPFLNAGGGYVFGKDGTDKNNIGLSNAGSIAGLKFYKSLKSILPLKVGDITYSVKESLFTSGALAVNLNGSWAIDAYKDAAKKKGFTLGVAKIPAINGKTPRSFSGVKIVGVNSYTKYPRAAQMLANFVTNEAAQLTQYQTTGALPTNTKIASNAAVKNDVIVQGFLAQLKDAEPMPSIAEMGAVWSPMAAAFADVWDKGTDPKEALDSAVSKIKKATK